MFLNVFHVHIQKVQDHESSDEILGHLVSLYFCVGFKFFRAGTPRR